MIGELGKYLTTFGLILLAAFFGLRIMTLKFKSYDYAAYKTGLNIFNMVVGRTELEKYVFSEG